MQIKLLLITLFASYGASAQMVVDSLVDERDGNTYKIVKIDSILWFQNNLKFETKGSYCPNVTKKHSKCSQGNYYPYTELKEICPTGWRLPSEIDWQHYFNYRLKYQKGSIQDVIIDSLNEEYLTLIYTDINKNVNLFAEDNPLGLSEFGWVQGHKLNRKQATATIWIKSSKTSDNRFHLHIGNNNYVYHRHKHNIDDKKRKRRRFMVKCVKSIQ